MKLIFRIALITLFTLGVIKTDRFFLKKPVFEIKNINDINLGDIKKKISEDVRVQKVFVKRNSLNGILISVEEREPKYLSLIHI